MIPERPTVPEVMSTLASEGVILRARGGERIDFLWQKAEEHVTSHLLEGPNGIMCFAKSSNLTDNNPAVRMRKESDRKWVKVPLSAPRTIHLEAAENETEAEEVPYLNDASWEDTIEKSSAGFPFSAGLTPKSEVTLVRAEDWRRQSLLTEIHVFLSSFRWFSFYLIVEAAGTTFRSSEP